jgi:hypothetical protein
MLRAGDFDFGPGRGLFGGRPLSLLLDFPLRETDLGLQQLHLLGGKLFALGAKEPEVKEPDLLGLQLHHRLQPGLLVPQPRILRLQAEKGFADGGRQAFERNHLMRNTYTIY